jgi:hypothetical protein
MPASPPITIAAFSGEQPRVIPRLLADNAATSAVNTRLDDGGLTPMRGTPLVASAGSGVSATWQTFFRYQGAWIGWDYPWVYACPGPVAQDRLYITGDGADPATAVPKMRIDNTIFNLAVPRPATPLTATLTGAASANPLTSTRGYIYTNVAIINGIEEESEPSAVSNLVDWQTGKGVDLSGFTNPSDAARGVTKQRIYRLQTGNAGTFYYLIAERNVSTGNYSDAIPLDKMAEPCPSINFNAPVNGLRGLIALPNGGMAAFKGKVLYFCEPWKPHAWPEIYALTCEHEIVGLGAIANSIVVATDAHPYFVSGGTPASMQMSKMEHNYPCVNYRSIVDLGYSIAYASWPGLVVASGDGSIGIATSVLFTRENWENFQPQEMIAAQLDGRYIAFYERGLEDGTIDAGALLFDLGNPSFLFRTDSQADAVFYAVDDAALYFKVPGRAEIRQLDSDNAGRLNLYWRSKEFVLPYAENYGAFRVDGVTDKNTVDQDTYDIIVAADKAANLALIVNGGIYTRGAWSAPMDPPGGGANGSIGGDLNALPLNEVPVNGDIMRILPYPPVTMMTAGVYCDKKLVGQSTKLNKAVRLPSGFRGRTWEIEVFSNQRIDRITMAKNMDDLKRI